ncbi:MAG: hypothetical protein A2096_13625 [Spirochaetes bacterium GWF1_41_5]|nr:MAG: hypothetical protein A2096_13625 [Spirochaetes bacterium GWF1_41_5]HBE02937.1 hypothetical protein [Spirochaetia bacterium]
MKTTCFPNKNGVICDFGIIIRVIISAWPESPFFRYKKPILCTEIGLSFHENRVFVQPLIIKMYYFGGIK